MEAAIIAGIAHDKSEAKVTKLVCQTELE
jgi:hypothetical protein